LRFPFFGVAAFRGEAVFLIQLFFSQTVLFPRRAGQVFFFFFFPGFGLPAFSFFEFGVAVFFRLKRFLFLAGVPALFSSRG